MSSSLISLSHYLSSKCTQCYWFLCHNEALTLGSYKTIITELDAVYVWHRPQPGTTLEGMNQTCVSDVMLLTCKCGSCMFIMWITYKNRTTPALAMAYASPRIPLPMIALPKLKTDIPNEVFPSNCDRQETEEQSKSVLNLQALAGFAFNYNKADVRLNSRL